MVRHQVQWRLRGGVLAVRLLPVALCAMIAGWAAQRAGSLAYTLLTVEATVLGALLLLWTLRTRVRLLGTGVEVRELGTRTYRWSEICEVTSSFGCRGVQLRFTDGSARTLPAPGRIGVAATDPDVEAAVTAIRTRWAEQVRPIR